LVILNEWSIKLVVINNGDRRRGDEIEASATFTEKEKANRGNSTRLKEQNRNEKCDLSNNAF